ncbi:MAG: hypothetical protein ACLP8S_01360 [Solirubrobacteraceae bacterium]
MQIELLDPITLKRGANVSIGAESQNSGGHSGVQQVYVCLPHGSGQLGVSPDRAYDPSANRWRLRDLQRVKAHNRKPSPAAQSRRRGSTLALGGELVQDLGVEILDEESHYVTKRFIEILHTDQIRLDASFDSRCEQLSDPL